MKKFLLLCLAVSNSLLPALAQPTTIKAYPTHWWVGMKNKQVQVMLHGTAIGSATFTVQYPGVKLLKVSKVENPNYVFLDLQVLPTAKPGDVRIAMNDKGKQSTFLYTLKARQAGKGQRFAQGVTSKDFMYLIMPDRFSNGDESNDRVAGMRDQSLRRDTVFNRHGGDFECLLNRRHGD